MATKSLAVSTANTSLQRSAIRRFAASAAAELDSLGGREYRETCMIAFEVTVNGEKPLTAGIGENGGLHAIVGWVGGPGRKRKLDLSVGGLANHEFSTWAERKLQVGDVVQVRIVDIETVDEPSKRVAEDPNLVERERRRYFEELKKEYGK